MSTISARMLPSALTVTLTSTAIFSAPSVPGSMRQQLSMCRRIASSSVMLARSVMLGAMLLVGFSFLACTCGVGGGAFLSRSLSRFWSMAMSSFFVGVGGLGFWIGMILGCSLFSGSGLSSLGGGGI